MSEFYQKKLHNSYNRLLDLNKDGKVTIADFDMMASRYQQLNNTTADDPRVVKLRGNLYDIFNRVVLLADTNRDSIVTFDEYLAFWNDIAKKLRNGSSFNDVGCEKWDEYLFHFFDIDDDGVVTKSEYTRILESLNFEVKVNFDECWNKISEIGKLDLHNFSRLAHEYFASENPNDIGNYMFGPVN